MATGRRRLVSYVGSYHGQTTGSALLSGHQTQATVIGLGNVTKVPYRTRTAACSAPARATAAR